ncbi:MAG: hypothetical protein GYB65_07350 [Chloroflexi bacterium]|nr:hypothetical protein [Chloroflexota bacterium]
MTNQHFPHKATLDRLLLQLPGVQGGQAFGYPAYKIDRKIFLFVDGTGIAIKLPAARVQDLIASDDPAMGPLEVETGVVWREWVSIDRADPEDYAQDMPLVAESIEFVLSRR